jgi:hypothetical protein
MPLDSTNNNDKKFSLNSADSGEALKEKTVSEMRAPQM